jgi:hypothetical protein
LDCLQKGGGEEPVESQKEWKKVEAREPVESEGRRTVTKLKLLVGTPTPT